jgi:flagellum-specific ATP synthase
MPRSANPDYVEVLTRARKVMSTYADMEELIRLGAYRPGSSPEVDEAIGLNPALEAFLGQNKADSTGLLEGYQRLAQILAVAPVAQPSGTPAKPQAKS